MHVLTNGLFGRRETAHLGAIVAGEFDVDAQLGEVREGAADGIEELLVEALEVKLEGRDAARSGV
jgi:hypothetical protein